MSHLKSLVAAMTLAVVSSNICADELETVVDKSAIINQSAANSQTKIDGISEQIQSKLQQFKAVNKETDGLKIYNRQMEKQLDDQIEELAQLATSIDQVTVIERQITPLMLRMIAGLKEFISLDVPFLQEERTNRLKSLEEMMSRADVAVSEKFRRIIEAYQVEVDYGRTIESYAGNALVNEKEQEVNFLRIGRVALVYQSRDKQIMGIWNQEAKKWEALDNDYRTQVSKGLRMAQKQLAPDMIMVPVYAAEAK